MKCWVLAICACVTLQLAGCAKTLPDNYLGPTAVVKDTYANFVKGGFFRSEKVDLFIVREMNGKYIDNSVLATYRASFKSSLGFALKPLAYERRIPIKPMTVTLAAVTQYAAGGQYGGSREPETLVMRQIKLNPVAGETYVVRGRVEDGNASVWLETAGGKIVGQ
jgi:hypothetical protein